jgi:hypothetical protein
MAHLSSRRFAKILLLALLEFTDLFCLSVNLEFQIRLAIIYEEIVKGRQLLLARYHFGFGFFPLLQKKLKYFYNVIWIKI